VLPFSNSNSINFSSFFLSTFIAPESAFKGDAYPANKTIIALFVFLQIEYGATLVYGILTLIAPCQIDHFCNASPCRVGAGVIIGITAMGLALNTLYTFLGYEKCVELRERHMPADVRMRVPGQRMSDPASGRGYENL